MVDLGGAKFVFRGLEGLAGDVVLGQQHPLVLQILARVSQAHFGAAELGFGAEQGIGLVVVRLDIRNLLSHANIVVFVGIEFHDLARDLGFQGNHCFGLHLTGDLDLGDNVSPSHRIGLRGSVLSHFLAARLAAGAQTQHQQDQRNRDPDYNSPFLFHKVCPLPWRKWCFGHCI